jgi:hypothetical protein
MKRKSFRRFELAISLLRALGQVLEFVRVWLGLKSSAAIRHCFYGLGLSMKGACGQC